MSDIFIQTAEQKEADFLNQGFEFLGHLKPPRITNESHELQEAALRAQAGGGVLHFIGDAIRTHDCDGEDPKLMFLDGWVVVYVEKQAPEVATATII